MAWPLSPIGQGLSRTLGLRIAHRFVPGIAQVQGRFMLLLDLAQVQDVGDLAGLAEPAPNPETP